MSQKEKNSEPQIVSDISSLLNNESTTTHSVLVDEQNPNLIMKVEVRELSFLDMQSAIKSFINLTSSGEVEIDLAGYWKYMYEKCIVSTEPNLSEAQLMGLNGYVGSQVSAILPQPTDLLTGPLGIGNDE